MLDQLYGVLEERSVTLMLGSAMEVMEATDSHTMQDLEILSLLDLDSDTTQEELLAGVSDQPDHGVFSQLGDMATMLSLETPLSDDLESDIIQEEPSAVNYFVSPNSKSAVTISKMLNTQLCQSETLCTKILDHNFVSLKLLLS